MSRSVFLDKASHWIGSLIVLAMMIGLMEGVLGRVDFLNIYIHKAIKLKMVIFPVIALAIITLSETKTMTEHIQQ